MTEDRSADTLAEDERQVRAVLDRLYAAWVDMDADGFVADYTEDASSIVPGNVRLGREQVRERMAVSFAGFLKGTTPVDEVQNVRFFGRDTAVLISRASFLAEGETQVPDNRWLWSTWTLARQDGRWRVAAYHGCPAEVPAAG